MRNLDRKVFDVNEARHLYEGRIEDVNDIITALLREDRLRVTHEGVSGGRKTFVLEPYTLLVYKKGLYLAGFSHQHQARSARSRSTGFARSSGCKGDRFDYPADYRPEQLTEGAFGLIRGEPTRVRIRSTTRSRATCSAGSGTRRSGSSARRRRRRDDHGRAGHGRAGELGAGLRRQGDGARAAVAARAGCG